MSQEVPDFQSNIPEHLLTSASPQDKYIMENISILNQKSNWLTKTQGVQFERLDEIKEQTTKTNGRVTILEAQTKKIESEVAKTNKIVKFYETISSYSKNKIVLACSFLAFLWFFTYCSPWIAINGKSLIAAFIKFFIG